MPGYQSFQTEHYFAEYEFSVKHLLAASDCESITIEELLALSGGNVADLGNLHLGYTESQGSPSLRSAIAAQYDSVDPDQVVVLNSPIEGIYLTMRSLLESGDRVVAIAPSYDALRNLPQDLHCDVQMWHLDESDGAWSIDLDRFAEMLDPAPKLVVLNFPHNPTGYLPTPDEFDRILELIEASGAWLYHDEIFRGLEHGKRPQLPSAAERLERTIVLCGLSKVHGLPGLRAGWLVVRDGGLRDEVMNTKMYTSICPPAPVEYITERTLSVADQLAAKNRALVSSNLDIADEFFERHTDTFRYARPPSGPIGLIGVEQEPASAFADRLVKAAGVMLLPSSSLGLGDTHVRFGFGRKSFPDDLAALDDYLS